MPRSRSLPRRAMLPDFSWRQARNDLPIILNSLAEPYRYPAIFMSIAGRHASEALALTLTQYEEISRPPLQSVEFEHLFRPLVRSFVKLTAAEVTLVSMYLAAIRPKIVREVRKQGRSACDHLFLTKDGKPINQDAFRKAFRRAGNAVTPQPFPPGGIRRLWLREVLAKLASTDREFAGVPWLKKSHLIEIDQMRPQTRFQNQPYALLQRSLSEASFESPENHLEA